MKTILVIEDNQEVRENLVEILELSSYKTIEAPNGKIGAKLAKEHRPDLILCDVLMPELDGFGVLKILNTDVATYDIPFIFLTAKVAKEDFRKGMGLGADDYITKPFDDVELLDAIEMRLKKNERLNNIAKQSSGKLQTFFSEAKAHEALSKLSSEREVRTYRKKDIIYEDGRQPRWLYYVESGCVKISVNSDYGKELIIKQFGPGDFFGYNALIQGERYSGSAIALEETRVKLIPKSDFLQLLFNERNFSAQFIKMISNEVTEIEQHLLDQAYGSVRRKVAQALLGAKESSRSERIQLSRDDLAALAGIAKETLIRTLSDFKRDGLIEVSHNGIEILNLQGITDIPQ